MKSSSAQAVQFAWSDIKALTQKGKRTGQLRNSLQFSWMLLLEMASTGEHGGCDFIFILPWAVFPRALVPRLLF